MRRFLSIGYFALLISVSAQLGNFAGIISPVPASVVPTPSIVNFSGMPSVEGTALGTQTFAGTAKCATQSYCAPVADASLSGNSIEVFYTYTEGATDTPTIATYTGNPNSGYTATGDTYTHCGTDAHTGTVFVGCFYITSTGATTSTVMVKLTFANGPTNVAVAVVQTTNTNAVDGYNSNTGAATTSWTTGSVTSTVNNDLYLACAVGVTTRTAVAAFTAGGSFTLELNDRRDALVCEWEVQSASGALNPAITAGTSNGYEGVTLALKSGSQGTAPSGMYVRRIYRVNSVSAASNLAYSIHAASGDLLAVTTSGGTQTITAVSDGTNGSWSSCNPANVFNFGTTGHETNTGAFYFANSASGDLAVTMTVSGTGDTGPAVFYDIAGAPSTEDCYAEYPVLTQAGASSTLAIATGYSPQVSSGIVIGNGSLWFNTSLGSNEMQDCATVGGQSINGPSLPDQNNGCYHFSVSSNASRNVALNLLDTTATNPVTSASAEVLSFAASGATSYPMVLNNTKQNHSQTSGTTIATTITPKHAGDTLYIVAGAFGISTGTITLSGGSLTYNAIDSATNAGGFRLAHFYVANVAASAVTITATMTSNSQRSIIVMDIAKANTSTPLDGTQHSISAITASTGGLLTGTSVTTGNANEIVVGGVFCNGTCDQTNTGFLGYATQPWTTAIGDTLGDIGVFFAPGAASTTTSITAIDSNGSGTVDAVVTAALKP